MNTKKCPVMHLFPRGKKARADAIHGILKEIYPNAECALDFRGDPFRLLVMARLSAQCTDKRVNEVSIPLFEKYPDKRVVVFKSRDEADEYLSAIK